MTLSRLVSITWAVTMDELAREDQSLYYLKVSQGDRFSTARLASALRLTCSSSGQAVPLIQLVRPLPPDILMFR